ncbi:GAF domain-containing protein [Candidatus Gracilibacteria bacterium]|nr:GAF domain-containing protein [Candidatus Gracilibacteria bacterium]
MNSTIPSSPLAAIVESSRLIVSTLDRDEVFRRILQAARELSLADSISIMLLDERRDYLYICAALGLEPHECAAFRLGFGQGVAGWVVAHGEPVHLVEPSTDARYVNRPGVRDLSNLLSLPLWSGDQTVGVLNLSYFDRYALFASDVVQTLEIFASHAAIAITNAATAARLRTIAQRERLLNLCNEALRSPQRAAELVQQVIAELATALVLDACLVVRGSGTALEYIVAWPGDAALDATWWPPIGDTLGIDRRADAVELYVALVADGRTLGWLRLISRRVDRHWSDEDLALIRAVADQVAAIQINATLIDREQRTRELSAIIARLLAAHHSELDREALLNQMLDQLAGSIAYDMAAIFLYRDDDYAYLVALRGAPRPDEPAIIYIGPGSLAARLFAAGGNAYLPDVEDEPAWQRLTHTNRVRSWIGVALRVDGRIIGMISLSKPQPATFSEEDVYLAQSFADQLSMGVYHAQLLHEARQRAAQLQVLQRFSMQLSAMQSVVQLLDEAARLLHETFGYYQVMLGLVVGDDVHLLAACGKIKRAEDLGVLRIHSTQLGLTGWAVRQRTVVLVNNVVADARFLPNDLLRDTAAELVVPMISSGRVLGLISVESNIVGAFDQSDRHLLEALAAQIAVALENIQRHEELRRINEQLAQSERLRALGELASGVAHDFNNLLASILGHTQLLLLDETRSDIRESLGIIERAALDGAATVRRLQDFAQTYRSTPGERVDINRLIEESLAITRPRWRDGLQSKGIQIVIQRQFGRVPPMLGDGPALRDMVTNLILNAIDAMPQGGTLHVRTSLKPDESAGVAALIEVSDTGVGIPDDIRDRIFDPFFTTKGQRGTGMGLAMVYGIVQRHRGRIAVESALSQGTSFQIALPLVAVSTPTLALTPPPGDYERLRVLVVDDEETVRSALVSWLRRWGNQVVEANSGEAALVLLESAQFDLLCTDLGMPGMSGWDLIARAHQIDAQLPVVLITGWGEQITLAEARAHGVTELLVKPFDGVRLRQAVITAQAIHRAQMKDELGAVGCS